MTDNNLERLAIEAGASRYTNRHYPDRPTYTFKLGDLYKFVRLVQAEQPAPQPAKPVMWIGKLDFDALQSRGRVTLTAYSEPVGSASNEVALCVQQPTAQQPAPQPLTDEQIVECGIQANSMTGDYHATRWAVAFARAIERAHGIGEQP